MEKKIIIVVDDSPSIIKGLFILLRDEYVVYGLPEPKKLNASLYTVTPDLFILDCNMPGINGLDLIPIIRARSAHTDTPIIIMSGDDSDDIISKAMSLGANDFIRKPIDEKLLREKVEMHLNKSK